MTDQFSIAHLQRIAEMDPSPLARDLARECLRLRAQELDVNRVIRDLVPANDLAREIARDRASSDPLDNLDAG